MTHRFQDPPFSQYWSTLRFASSSWVSEMLTANLTQSAVSNAMTLRLEQNNKRDKWIHMKYFLVNFTRHKIELP